MDYICTRCNYTGQRKKTNAGSNLISAMLWIVLPSIYMLWGLNTAESIMESPVSAIQNIQNYSTGTISIILTLLGPAYSIWRRVKKTYACPKCNEKIMVAVGTLKKNTMLVEDDLSIESIKKVPFIWAKDVQEYKERHKEASEPEDVVKLVVTDKRNNNLSSWTGSKDEW